MITFIVASIIASVTLMIIFDVTTSIALGAPSLIIFDAYGRWMAVLRLISLHLHLLFLRLIPSSLLDGWCRGRRDEEGEKETVNVGEILRSMRDESTSYDEL